MTCAHCCFSCTSVGEDMTMETFIKGIEQFGVEAISIGGGEPTIHPRFWDFMIHAMANVEYVWMATNGTKTKTSLLLAKMAAKGLVSVELSRDDFHSDIDPEVIEAFTPERRFDHIGWRDVHEDSSDGRGIRDVTDSVKAAGRAIETSTYVEEDGCACAGNLIIPSGKIKWCACNDAPIVGDVQVGYYKNYEGIANDGEYECYKNYKKEMGENNDNTGMLRVSGKN